MIRLKQLPKEEGQKRNNPAPSSDLMVKSRTKIVFFSQFVFVGLIMYIINNGEYLKFLIPLSNLWLPQT